MTIHRSDLADDGGGTTIPGQPAMRNTILSAIAAAAFLLTPALGHAQVDTSTDTPAVEADSTEAPPAGESGQETPAPYVAPGEEPTFMVWGALNASEDYYIGGEVGVRWKFIGISAIGGELNRDLTPAYLSDPLPASSIVSTNSFRRSTIGASLHGFYGVTPSITVSLSAGVAKRSFDVVDATNVTRGGAQVTEYHLSQSKPSEDETVATWGFGLWWGGDSHLVVGAGYNSAIGISAGVGYRW